MQLRNKSKGYIKILSGVFLFTILGKLIGFIRELLLSYFYGASGVVDAYLISQTIPGTIFQFVGTGLATCFIPLYYKIKEEKCELEANKFVNRILTVILLFSSVVIVIVLLWTPDIVKIFASGFEGQTLDYAIIFTRIAIFSLIFSSFVYVFTSFLQAQNKFNVVAFSAVLNGLIVLLFIVLSCYIDIWILCVGGILSVFIQALFLWIPSHRQCLKLYPCFKWNEQYTLSFFKLLLPVVIGVSVSEINVLIDRTLASQLAIGGISALSYANSIVMLAQGGFVQSVTTVFYPRIADSVAKHNDKQARDQTQTIMTMLVNILIPISACFIIFSEPITVLVFGRGAFDQTAISMTSGAIRFYSIGICFYGLREILSRYFYAYSDTKTPMIISAIGVLCNILLNIVFAKFWGLFGLALATSISNIITVILLWILMNRKNPLLKSSTLSHIEVSITTSI